MNGFKIGERYKVNKKGNYGQEGSIIEITGCNDISIYYKVISTKSEIVDFSGLFHNGSYFSNCLDPVTTCDEKTQLIKEE